MHIAEHMERPESGLITPVDPEAEERRRKITAATGTRTAAYEKLRLSESERAAMEWACTRRQRQTLAGLRPFFDEAESATDEEQVAAWLGGPAFHGANEGKLKDAIASAVEGFEKSLRAERRAERAEIGITWFLMLASIGIVAVCIIHLLTR